MTTMSIAPPRASYVADRLENVVTQLGMSRNAGAYARFGFRILSDYQLEAAYQDDWIPRKVVDVPAGDMVRKWRRWSGDAADVKKIQDAEYALGLQAKTRRAICWARLYGGAALYLDDGGDPAKEIRPDSARKGRLQNIHVFSRKKLYPTGEYEETLGSRHFGEPLYFFLTSSSGVTTRVHRSRVIPFKGNPQPDIDSIESFWGDSVLRAAYDALINASKAPQVVASLIEEAKVDIIKVKDLVSQISTSDDAQRTVQRWQLYNLSKSISQTGLMDMDNEELDTRQISFTDLDKVMTVFFLAAAGASDIPVTRLLGQSPAGMNATGESDLRNYYDRIGSDQEAYLAPALMEIDSYLLPTIFGTVPDGVDWEFRSLMSLSEKERAETNKTTAETVSILSGSQVVDQIALKKATETIFSDPDVMPGFAAGLAESEEMAGEAEEEMIPPDADEEGDDDDALRIEQQQADARPRTLYIARKVKNAQQIIAWARAQGFKNLLPAGDLHVTVAHSRVPVDWMDIRQDFWEELEIEGGARIVEPLGSEGAIVLLFKSNPLESRWRELHEEHGLLWDYPEYQPHITLTYEKGDLNLKKVEPYHGPIILGAERFEEIDFDWTPSKTKEKAA